MKAVLAKITQCCGPAGCGKYADDDRYAMTPDPETVDAVVALAQPRFCITSNCMAWRWLQEADEEAWTFAGSPPPEGDGWLIVLNPKISIAAQVMWIRPLGDQREGFCGLAGKP